MLLIVMLMNFNPLIKVLLFVPQCEDLYFFSFVRGTNLFSVSIVYGMLMVWPGGRSMVFGMAWEGMAWNMVLPG